MAVNLSKNKDEMLKAWSDVVDDKCSTDWALYGYDKQTNDLKLISTGEDGLEELCDEFNSGKIMYAFCRVFDSKTSLPKFVLVNWQGEGAPTIRKGNCAHHIHDVKKFFKGIHIMVNARTDEEVEPEVILEKVSKSTGSSYNFKQRSSAEDQNQPVASVYKRVLPKTEINSNERDKFWEEQEKEEKQRLAEEQKKFAEQRKKLEDERKERECKETAAREEVVKERSRSINEMRKAEKLVEQSESTKVVNKEKWNRQLQEDMKDEEIRKKRSESLRDERNQETQQLISQRTIDARAVFEQNTNAGQMVSRKNSGARSNSLSSPTEVTSSPVDIGKEESIAKKQEEPITQVAEQVVETKEITYTRNLLKEGLPPCLNSDVEDEEESNWDEPPLEDPPKFDSPFDLIKDTNQPQTVSTDSHVQANKVKVDEKCIKARALYDYQAVDDTEISFDPDDIISNIEMIDEGWWQGVGPDGTFGLFPANYVEVIE